MKNKSINAIGSPAYGDVHSQPRVSKIWMGTWFRSILPSICLFVAGVVQAERLQVRVTVENLMPEKGSLITPTWVGFHEGEYDFFDTGSASSEALESLAEDGNPSDLSESFNMPDSNRLDGVLNAIGPIPPGALSSKSFFIDDENPSHRFFSYAAMLIPSNDAFIGNDASDAYALFDDTGQFNELELMVTRSMVYDAGVEVNDELPVNTPALGQMTPNTGMDEQGVISMHEGHMPSESGGIVDRDTFSNADFSDIQSPLVRITVSLVERKPVDITLRIENKAPEKGLYFTPVWLGFHDGSVQVYELSQPASTALERIAEDGNPSPLTDWFVEQEGAGMHVLVTSDMNPPVFAPGSVRELTIQLDANHPNHQFLSFVSMVIPSNDAFISSGEPIQVFDDSGNLLLSNIQLNGAMVLDAGTEQNTEMPVATPLLGQGVPNTGPEESGVVHIHEGFKAVGRGGILDLANFENADFTQPKYSLFQLQALIATRITGIEVNDENLTLQWMGGDPPYQVQQKSTVNAEDWSALGEPISSSMVTFKRPASEAYFRVLSLGPPAKDTTAPVITLNGNAVMTLECNIDRYQEPGAAAFDAVDPNVSIVIGGDTVDPNTLGVYTVTYDAVDSSGNAAAQMERTVTVVDTTAPVITLTGNAAITLERGMDTYQELGAEAVDACDSNVAIVVGGDTVDASTLGIYTVTYDAVDSSGNAAVQIKRTVTVVDTTTPMITLNGNASITLECNIDSYQELGADAVDTSDPNIAVVVGGDTVDPSILGVYTVTYDAVDSSGNAAAQIVRSVTVVDTTAPLITFNGNEAITLECSIDSYQEPGAVAADACDPNVTVVVGGDTVDPSTLGVYTVTYNAVDSSGNAAAQIVRTVTVVDTTAPVITLKGDAAITLERGMDSYQELGATVVDACDPNVAVVVGGDNVDPSTLGVYTVTYNVVDSSGNAAAPIVRTVTVVDTTAKFRLTFNATWSAATHPDMFPGNPHFSGLIGATHNESDQFWESGALASRGIESMAETGSKSALISEIQQAMDMGWADTLISGGGIGRSPGSVSVEFEVSGSFPLLTLVSMIAPSPDWFVGVHGLDLRPGGKWIDSMTVELPAYDAGTDDGPTYTSPNDEPNNHQPISRLVSSPVLHQGVAPAFGNFSIQRIE